MTFGGKPDPTSRAREDAAAAGGGTAERRSAGRRLRAALGRLALAATFALLTLAALEVAVRVVGSRTADFASDLLRYQTLTVWDAVGEYFTHAPNVQTVIQGVRVDLNSLGMRDVEPVVPKPPGRFRLLCLGDSVTFGPGVPVAETFPQRLPALLAAERVDVVEAAVPGWNTVQETRFLGRYLDTLAPDLVVLLYVVNDNERLDPYIVAHRPAVRPWTRLYRALVLRSRLCAWLALRWRTRAGPNWPVILQMSRWQEEQRATGPSFGASDPGWLESRAALEEMTRMIRARGARLVVFFWNLDDRPPAPAARDRLREFGAARDVPVVDMLPFFAGHERSALVNIPFGDPHPNADGHALAAEGIARVLREGGFVAPTR